MGYLRLARLADTPAAAEERLRRAEDEAALLNNAVTSLLNFSKPLNVQFQSVDVTQLIREIVGQLEQSTAGIEISIEGELVVDGDPTLLRRLFENLLRNAIDAIRAKGGQGTIAVRGTTEPPSVSISDNGIGVSGDDVQRLFLPFQSNRTEGFGLGLALAKKIALLHGGSIVLTGEANVGATATVEFRASALAPDWPQNRYFS
jgi:signal transduction histidine kinase